MTSVCSPSSPPGSEPPSYEIKSPPPAAGASGSSRITDVNPVHVGVMTGKLDHGRPLGLGGNTSRDEDPRPHAPVQPLLLRRAPQTSSGFLIKGLKSLSFLLTRGSTGRDEGSQRVRELIHLVLSCDGNQVNLFYMFPDVVRKCQKEAQINLHTQYLHLHRFTRREKNVSSRNNHVIKTHNYQIKNL